MQILYPGTREQEFLFDTNLDGVSGFIVADRRFNKFHVQQCQAPSRS